MDSSTSFIERVASEHDFQLRRSGLTPNPKPRVASSRVERFNRILGAPNVDLGTHTYVYGRGGKKAAGSPGEGGGGGKGLNDGLFDILLRRYMVNSCIADVFKHTTFEDTLLKRPYLVCRITCCLNAASSRKPMSYL